MKFGAIFPQTEIGDDPLVIRDYAQAVEGMGYDFVLAYDHVVGASTKNRPNWSGPYTSETPFHEIFVLFGYLAGVTRTLGLVSGVVILPQRQTVLVAKQAAQVDVLSGGRMRLGVGIGWNDVEYEALNEDFHTRGARIEEQIEVMRALWTQPVVTFKGKQHQITEAGILPMPVQRPIPVWLGGYADAVLRRVARIGDGWMPHGKPDDAKRAQIEQVHQYMIAAGREPSSLGIQGFIDAGHGTPAEWSSQRTDWQALGATHICIHTMRAGYRTMPEHLDALRRMQETLGIGAAKV